LSAGHTAQQKQNYLHNLAKKTNISVARKNQLPSTKVRIRDVQVQDNYVLNLNYQGYLRDKKLIKKFKRMHSMKARNKFCKNSFYKRMQDGLKINFTYFNHKNNFITNFYLDEKKCTATNKRLNTLLASSN